MGGLFIDLMGNLDSCICWSFVGGAFFLLLTYNYSVFYCLVIDWVCGGFLMRL